MCDCPCQGPHCTVTSTYEITFTAANRQRRARDPETSSVLATVDVVAVDVVAVDVVAVDVVAVEVVAVDVVAVNVDVVAVAVVAVDVGFVFDVVVNVVAVDVGSVFVVVVNVDVDVVVVGLILSHCEPVQDAAYRSLHKGLPAHLKKPSFPAA